MNKKRLDKIEIHRIKYLRSKGYSLGEISKKMKRGQATVFRYVKGVSILPEFISVWSQKRGGSKAKKINKEELALGDGKKLVGKLSYKEKLLFLSALYWAEGNKKDFILTNSDPALISIFVQYMREVFQLPEDKFRISIRIYKDLDKDGCLNFWSNITKIPKEKFVSVNVLGGKKNGKLIYGMCRVRITKGGDLLKKITGINKAVHLSL